MDRSEFLLQMDELLDLDPGTLKGNESLDTLDGWNSLAVIGYMAVVNDRFGIILSPRQIAACSTIDQLIDLPSAPSAR